MLKLIKKHSLAWKLIKALVAFSSLITIIITAAQLWLEYSRDISVIDSGFNQVERSYLESISENVWESDSGRLELLVEGLMEFPDFEFASVRDENSTVLYVAGVEETGSFIRKVYPLYYTFRNEKLLIGELEVVASLTQVYVRTLNRVGVIMLSNAIKTFLVALFMFLTVYWLFTRHLESLTNFATQMDFDKPTELLHLDRGIFSGKRDEVDQLTDAINDMQKRLFNSHSAIEEQVKERTKSLTEEIQVRKNAEGELRKLSRAVEQSPNVVFITNITGIIEYVNPQFEKSMGYCKEEVLGSTPSIIKSGDTPREVYDDLWSTVLSGNEWRGELKDKRKNGDVFWASSLITPVRDDHGVITNFVATHEDITVRKEANQAMQDAKHAAEISNKAKTDLLANMSHELRTPLNAIIGFSETMVDSIFGPMENKNYEEYAQIIHSSGLHLLQLINDILDVSAVESGKLQLREEHVNIVDTCDASIRIISPLAQSSNISVTSISNKELPLLLGDPLRLKQILLNLVSNAVKFTPDNGSVSCDAYVDDKNRLVISVADTGIGMDEAGIQMALDRFGQVDSSLARSHEGTGLGLPLTKGLVELHGGTLEIKSELGKGTKVQICFPAERVVGSDA